MVNVAERPSLTNGNAVGGRAVIYVRVSKTTQKDGASLDVQLETCRQYCERSGLEIVAEFKDIKSGLVVEWDQYQQVL